jgi:hypothetical protein
MRAHRGLGGGNRKTAPSPAPEEAVRLLGPSITCTRDIPDRLNCISPPPLLVHRRHHSIHRAPKSPGSPHATSPIAAPSSVGEPRAARCSTPTGVAAPRPATTPPLARTRASGLPVPDTPHSAVFPFVFSLMAA